MESQLLEHFLASGASALSSPAFSKYMDATDPLRELRNEFEIPKIKNVVSDDAGKLLYLGYMYVDLRRNLLQNPMHAFLTTLFSVFIEIPDRDRDKECIYFCGNSLGLLPKKSRDLVERELKAWSEQ
jgi:kynureninase